MTALSYDRETRKAWWHAALVRAVRTFAQTLVGSIPAGFVITPAMVEHMDWSLAVCAGVWVANAGFAAVLSILSSIAGLPEVEAPDAE